MSTTVMHPTNRRQFEGLRTRDLAVGAMLSFVSIASLLGAQQARPADRETGFERVTAQPIDQRVEDINPLAASLRHVDAGLDEPLRFAEVFRLSDGRYMRVDGALHAVFPRSVYTGETQQGAARVPPGTVFHIGSPLPDDFAHDPARGEAERFMPYQINSMLRDTRRFAPAYDTRWNTFAGAIRQRAHDQPSAHGPSGEQPPGRPTINDDQARRLHFGDTVRPMPRNAMTPATGSLRGAVDENRAPRIWGDQTYRTSRMHALLRAAASAERASRTSGADDQQSSTGEAQ